jgi:hypothetical protein
VKNMKRTTGVMVAMWLVVLLSLGPALAALPLIVGTNAGEQIRGTRNAEEIRGLGGLDEITDGLGGDLVYGGAGGDNLIGYGGDTSGWITSTAGVGAIRSSRGMFPPPRMW